MSEQRITKTQWLETTRKAHKQVEQFFKPVENKRIKSFLRRAEVDHEPAEQLKGLDTADGRMTLEQWRGLNVYYLDRNSFFLSSKTIMDVYNLMATVNEDDLAEAQKEVPGK